MGEQGWGAERGRGSGNPHAPRPATWGEGARGPDLSGLTESSPPPRAPPRLLLTSNSGVPLERDGVSELAGTSQKI